VLFRSLVLVAETERWVIGNVGDSRGYLLRDGKLRRVTRDHTVVQDLVESGALAPDATADHPLGHLINRAVGTEGSVEADIFEGDAMSGDIFLLCTDGLVGLIMDDELEGLLQGLTSDGLEDKTAELIEVARTRGAPDNVTVGFLALEEST
jgi:protein phosphatase